MKRLLAVLTIGLLVAADADKVDVKKEMEKLEGDWTMVSGQRDGMSVPDELLNEFKRHTKDGVTTVSNSGQVFLKAKIKIDPTKKPKTIDYTIVEGAEKDNTMLGIYEFDGDKIKFCIGGPGNKRPTEFTAKEGSGQTLSVWKRAKK
jgi:uncharacterized protein (TIGR03067 family)